jgi:hypothetical protein
MKTGKPIDFPESELGWRMILSVQELERQEGRGESVLTIPYPQRDTDATTMRATMVRMTAFFMHILTLGKSGYQS